MKTEQNLGNVWILITVFDSNREKRRRIRQMETQSSPRTWAANDIHPQTTVTIWRQLSETHTHARVHTRTVDSSRKWMCGNKVLKSWTQMEHQPYGFLTLFYLFVFIYS